MPTLNLYLTKDATRSSLLEQFEAAAGAELACQCAATASAASLLRTHYHDVGEVQEAISALEVPDSVKALMREVYLCLAQAEAKVHGVAVEQAHFHEVGRREGLRNVLHICLLASALKGWEIAASPVQMGRGTVQIAHGEVSLPAPATAEVLRGGIPVVAQRLEGERCTPTSAALIKTLVKRFVTEGHELGVPPKALGLGQAQDQASPTPQQLAKLQELRALMRGHDACAIAFSGGVDSSLLLKAAHQELSSRAFAVTVDAPLIPARETRFATAFCRDLGIDQLVVECNPLQVEGVFSNPVDRCYHCKTTMLSLIRDTAKKHALSCGFISECGGTGLALLEGSNATDRKDWRPGSRAVAEQGFTSPLDEVGLSKEDVRSLARHLGLSVWDKPSFACLATRFPYGQAITLPLLERVGQAEQLLLDQGFSQVRVRIHDEGVVARVEVPEGDIARAVHVLLECGLEAQLKELGFKHVALEMSGYVSGSMNN